MQTYALEASTKETRINQLSQVYGFVIGQNTALDIIRKEYPDLAYEINESIFEFNSSDLGYGVKGIENELSASLGKDWERFKIELSDQFSAVSANQRFSKPQAIEFIKQVKRRSKGGMPDSILMTLLSSNPTFQNNPARELSSGWKQVFNTKGHPKAKGVDLSISYPASWHKREGHRPNIIQVFRSKAGHGGAMSNVMVKDIPLQHRSQFTGRALEKFFQPKSLAEMVPDNGEFIEAKYLVIEGLPAGMLVNDQVVKRMDAVITMRMTQFITYYEGKMIFIQFLLSELPDSDETLDQLQKRYFPAFMSIANSLVLNKKYRD